MENSSPKARCHQVKQPAATTINNDWERDFVDTDSTQGNFPRTWKHFFWGGEPLVLL